MADKPIVIDSLSKDEIRLVVEALELYVSSKRRMQNASADNDIKAIAARRIAAAQEVSKKLCAAGGI